MNVYEQILQEEEQKIQPEVEQVFTSVEEARNNPILKDFTDEAKVKQLEAVAETAENKLQAIKDKYGQSCKTKIEATEVQVPTAKITNDFELQKVKLTLITMDPTEQLDYLASIDNPEDFILIKGLLLEAALQAKDNNMITTIQKYKINDAEAQKTRALGQLSILLNSFGQIPGLSISRKLSVNNSGGIGEYIRTLLGISRTDYYFR